MMRCLLAALPIAVLAGCHAPPDAPVPKPEATFTLAGHWRVVDLLVDTGATRRLAYAPHDPAAIGKTVDVDATSVRSSLPEGIDCTAPSATPGGDTLAERLANTAPPRNDPPVPAVPADYGLAAAGARPVIVLTCTKGSFGPSANAGRKPMADNTNWGVPLDGGRWALHWYDESLLVLERAH